METAQAFAWVIATAQADSALTTASVGGVWQGYADIATPTPYTLVTQPAGSDTLTMNAKRLFSRLTLQIKAVGPASGYAALVTIANRIDALFGDKKNVALAPGWMLSSFREQPLAYEEVSNGVQISHLGGLYHIDLQGS